MALYEYKALDAAGKAIKGMVEADSVKTARSKLKKSGIFLTDIAEKSTGGAATRDASGKMKQGGGGGFHLFGRITLNDVSMFTRQMSSLIKASITVVDALSALIDQTENERFKVVLSLVRQDVNEGASLGKALSKHPKVFNSVFINMVEAGEASGTLPIVLIRLADFQEGQVRLKNKVSSAMMYPILMMCVASLLIIGIFTFVMPKLAKIFDAMHKDLPIQTKIMLAISDFLVNYWYIPLPTAIAAIWLFMSYISTAKGRRWWHGFLLGLPVLGKLIRMLAVARFANSLAAMLAGGVPILTAMNIVKNIVGNELIMEAISLARENVTEGQSIAEPLKRSQQFPPLVIHMISIGEKTGELPQMLQNVSSTFEEQVTAKIEGLTALLEPAMIVIMGIVVALIVVSIFVPLLQLNDLR
jgi:general secretion pathway protein F